MRSFTLLYYVVLQYVYIRGSGFTGRGFTVQRTADSATRQNVSNWRSGLMYFRSEFAYINGLEGYFCLEGPPFIANIFCVI